MSTLRILLIEDTESDYLLIARHVRNCHLETAVHWVQNEPELEAALSMDGWDLVLSDYKVPGIDFLHSLNRLKQDHPHVPVILVSGSIGEETAVDLLKNGLADFVLKDRLFRLVPAIERSLNEAMERRKRREAETLFRSIIDNANSAIWVKDREGRILASNKFLLNLLHTKEGDFIGKTVFDLLPPKQAADFAAHEQSIITSGIAGEREETLLFPDGERTMLSIKFPLKDETGAVQSLGAICSDITRIKQAETRLKQQEEQFRQLSQEYRTLLDNVPDGIVHLSPDLHVLWINNAAQRMFGLDADAPLEGKACFTSFWGLTSQCAGCPVVRSLDSRTNEIGCLSPGSNGQEFEIRAVPVRNESGALTSIIEIVRDISAQRKLEEQFRQAQKMESIGTLAGGIAHDFNNMLSAILGYGEMALEDLAEDHPATSSVRTIIEAGQRASHLTKDLLMFSRKQVTNKEKVDVNALIERIEKLIRRIIGEDIQFETHLAKTPLLVSADRHQLDQVLMNFATNARDAMPAGGALTIASARVECDLDFIARHGFGQPGPYAQIKVADTGKGMDPATAAKIFDPFFTTKEVGKGTGLGLAVVYGIIAEHQGHIEVVSAPGAGAAFAVFLPLVEERREQIRSQDDQEKPRGGTETILLAEDDGSVRELFVRLLTNAGYTVIEAVNGEDAIRQSEQHRNAIDLLISDLIMPKMNGKQAYEIIRQSNPATKVLFVSGYAPENILQKDLLDLHAEILYKPVPPKELLKKVRRVLDGA